MTKNSSPFEGSKTGAQLQTTWRSAKNGLKQAKKPLNAAIPSSRRARLCCELKCPPTPAMN